MHTKNDFISWCDVRNVWRGKQHYSQCDRMALVLHVTCACEKRDVLRGVHIHRIFSRVCATVPTSCRVVSSSRFSQKNLAITGKTKLLTSISIRLRPQASDRYCEPFACAVVAQQRSCTLFILTIPAWMDNTITHLLLLFLRPHEHKLRCSIAPILPIRQRERQCQL